MEVEQRKRKLKKSDAQSQKLTSTTHTSSIATLTQCLLVVHLHSWKVTNVVVLKQAMIF